MIIALLLGGFAFFGLSGNTDYFEDTLAMWHRAVKKSVDDDTRRETALQLVESTKDAVKEKERILSISYRTLSSIDQRYGASEAEYELAAERIEGAWRAVDSLLLENRAALRQLLTPAEWNEVVRRIDKASGKMAKAIQKKLDKGDKSK